MELTREHKALLRKIDAGSMVSSRDLDATIRLGELVNGGYLAAEYENAAPEGVILRRFMLTETGEAAIADEPAPAAAQDALTAILDVLKALEAKIDALSDRVRRLEKPAFAIAADASPVIINPAVGRPFGVVVDEQGRRTGVDVVVPAMTTAGVAK